MRRPFTAIGGVLLLLIAAINVYYAYKGLGMTVNGQSVPAITSYVTAAITGIVGLLQLMELRR